MNLKLISVVAVLLFAAALVSASFEITKLNMTIEPNKDGSAHVKEIYELTISSSESINYYENALRMTPHNDVGAWRKALGLENFAHHMDTGVAQISGTTIQPILAPNTCGKTDVVCRTTIAMEYDAKAYQNGTASKGIFEVQKIGPRTRGYTFNPAVLGFPKNEREDITIPDGTSITITVPENAIIKRLKPKPPEMGNPDLPLTKVQQVVWNGPYLLSQMEFYYETEDSMDTEVAEFFTEVKTDLTNFAYSQEGAAAFLILLIIGVSVYALKTRKTE
ncbi:Uncharacterised protein [Candidatus Gugararchaeum adminiculabundum]|nr:Uncharacterised protein [Candidatus Gugararchaeum adminiculabundum]